jgi:hypothetical protein
MKIIDFRKDFYDWFGGYDVSDDISYVRKTTVLENKNDDHQKIIKELLQEIKNDIPDYHNVAVYGKDDYHIYIEHVIVGFYPNIYIAPFLIITDGNRYNIESKYKPVPLPIDIYNNETEIQKLLFDKYPELSKMKLNYHFSRSKSKYKWDSYYKKFASKFVFENKNVFEKILKVPVFVYFPGQELGHKRYTYTQVCDNMFYDGDRYSYIFSPMYTSVILNPVFNEFRFNCLKPISDLLDNQPIYTDIENFLWAVKQEPISEPDNKTKILNHGFDLKTSFRKM